MHVLLLLLGAAIGAALGAVSESDIGDQARPSQERSSVAYYGPNCRTRDLARDGFSTCQLSPADSCPPQFVLRTEGDGTNICLNRYP
jgi:hypothetical protein